MADPFEVRLRFTNTLQHLSASTTSAHKAAAYALKHRDMDEDLHSCILEQLERNNMNNRANIMYFLEPFCDLALRENNSDSGGGGANGYLDMVRRDIVRIVDAVAPRDGSGAANVKVVRRVLPGLEARGVLSRETIQELEERLKEREVHPDHLGAGDVMGDVDENYGEGNDDARVKGSPPQQQQQQQTVGGSSGREYSGTMEQEKTTPTPTPTTKRTDAGMGGVEKRNGIMRVDKKVVEQRIEEDRERNKRLRESMWAVSADDDEELDKMWEEGSDVNEDDLLMAEEEAAERRMAAHFDST